MISFSDEYLIVFNIQSSLFKSTASFYIEERLEMDTIWSILSLVSDMISLNPIYQDQHVYNWEGYVFIKLI